MADGAIEGLLAERGIRRLISAYCDAVGRRDAFAAGNLYAPDARIKIADFPEIVGREAIADGLRQTFAAADFLHQKCDTGLIDVAGGHARSRLSVFEVNRKPGQHSLGLIFGFYEDEYARLDEGWRFLRRRYTLQLRALLPVSKIQQLTGFIPEVAFAP